MLKGQDISRRMQHLGQARAIAARRGFTLIDVLVSLGVIALIMSLLLPSMATVTEAGRRIVCQSNLRQLGTGVLQYAEDNMGLLLPTVYLQTGPGRAAPEPESTVELRVDLFRRNHADAWDGLGVLYQVEQIDAPKVFYCPSHRGDFTYAEQAPNWRDLQRSVVGNFQYRGQGPNQAAATPGSPIPTTRFLYDIDPSSTSLIADALRSREEFNHAMGVNFFRADLTIRWFNDPQMRIRARLAPKRNDAVSDTVLDAWAELDAAGMAPIPTID